MTKIKKTYSYFCKKRPQKNLTFACVYFPKEMIWRVCLGKFHATGRFRYIYNGIEGITTKYNIRYYLNSKPVELQKIVIYLNIRSLELMFPKPLSRINKWMMAFPVVAEEDDLDEMT